jgi:nucleolar GTP-binding protein
MTAAGLDPSRIQERATLLAKVQGAKRKRAAETMDVDMDDAEGNGEDEGDWMDVDGEDTPNKRARGNTGAVVAVNSRAPRTNRQLAGMRDTAVCHLTLGVLILLTLCMLSCFQQASKAVKLRNLGQRPRNMLAKAGESDRAIRVKMVRSHPICLCIMVSSSRCPAQTSFWYVRLVSYPLDFTEWFRCL